MSELYGLVHLLIGLAYLALAVLIPPRAVNVVGGLLLSGLFLAGALERFMAGYWRLVDADLTDDRRASSLLLWAVVELVILVVLTVIATQSPDQHSMKKPDDKTPGD